MSTPVDAQGLVRDAVARFAAGEPATHVLIAAPAGFGKTTLLAVAQRDATAAAVRAVWVSGSTVASDGHFFDLLAQGLGGVPLDRDWVTAAEQIRRLLDPRDSARTLLLLDDFDQLTSKREDLVGWFARVFRSCPPLQVIGTCRPTARERLVGDGRPLAGFLHVATLEQLRRADAVALVRRRARSIAADAAEAVHAAAGGHPAALVFLSRLLELRSGSAEVEDVAAVIEGAAELAGAVYAEQWAALGPQQRALLWHLGAAGPSGASAAAIADALVLSPSHVSAQLTRLGSEGLVHRTAERARFAVAPLLATWIARRAARGRPIARAVRHRTPPVSRAPERPIRQATSRAPIQAAQPRAVARPSHRSEPSSLSSERLA